MISASRSFFVFIIIVLGTGCMVEVNQVDGSHAIYRTLTQDQVKRAIIDGAQQAGWRTNVIGSNTIVASYAVRTHIVQIKINYSDDSYSASYYSSSGMKIYCTKRGDGPFERPRISGQQDCPGNEEPKYIHGEYKAWMNSLNGSIQRSLALAIAVPVAIADKRTEKIAELKLVGGGSGFVVNSEGYALTNHHVIEDCTAVAVLIADESRQVKLAATDESNDLALLKLSGTFPNVAQFRESRRAILG